MHLSILKPNESIKSQFVTIRVAVYSSVHTSYTCPVEVIEGARLRTLKAVWVKQWALGSSCTEHASRSS